MKYPVGLQDFRRIREDGWVYVDKTRHIHGIIDQGGYFFLSRPRRFGKSLTLSTINELYSGDKGLFDGLWIQDHWDFAAKQRPVVWLKVSSLSYDTKGVDGAFNDEIIRQAGLLNVVLPSGGDLKDNFLHLLRTLSARDGKVVLLIDEYDKPIVDYLNDLDTVDKNRTALKRFYSTLKDSDPYLELVFITGVSAFAQVSIFSDLNNVTNLSLDRRAYHLTGITQSELEEVFAVPLAEEDAETVRFWYNGYSWGSEEKLYNPFSLLSFLTTRQYRNYWYATGTPTWLLTNMRRQRYYNVERRLTNDMQLLSFDAKRLDTTAVLFQTGYVTVVDYDPVGHLFTLDYPNKEVREAMQQHLLMVYMDFPQDAPYMKVFELRNAILRDDLDQVINIINALFANLPYDFWKRDDEHFFHAIIHLTFSLLGVRMQSEVHTNRGRCDALVKTASHIYVFEFKRDVPVEDALRQIEDRGYLEPFKADEREKVAVGVVMDTATKQVTEWRALRSGR